MKIVRMLAALAMMAALFVVACGGGNGPRVGAVTPAGTLRSDLLYGYYYANSMTQAETAQHVNLHWAGYQRGFDEQMAGITQARAHGQSVVVMLQLYDFPLGERAARLREQLNRLKGAGLLWNGIVGFYPMDEPDINGHGESSVTATNQIIRSVLVDYPEVAGAKLLVIYSCGSGRRPGIASYDWIGCDHYDVGCGVLSGHVAQLRSAMTSQQRLMLVPGGASPWRQDPACFEAYAHKNTDVVAVIAFLWQTEGGMAGIRDNGMRKLYCEAGRKIVAPAAPLNC